MADTEARHSPPAAPVHRSEFAIRIPRSPREAQKLAALLGKLLRESERIRARKQARIAKLRERIAKLEQEEAAQADPIEDRVRRAAMKLRVYIEEHRDELTEHGRLKTVQFPSGVVYRWQGSRATLIEDVEAFFGEVDKLGWGDDFTRTTREPNRNALLEEGNADRVAKLESVQIVEGTKPVITVHGATRRVEGFRSEASGITRFALVEPRRKM